MADKEPHSPHVKPLSPPEATPVFNCIALVASRNPQGMITARAANLTGASGSGQSEREALQQLIAEFKRVLVEHQSEDRPPPWIDPPGKPAEGETERFLAVHL